jgi:Ca2+-binding EF-hand superfamily protein
LKESLLVKKLREYKGVSHLKRAAINMMVKMSNEAETKSLTEQFKRLDTDGTGMISIEELKQWMNKIHPEIDQIEV